MLTLAHPWLLLLLPLPLLVRWLLPAHREPRQGVIVPFLDRLAEQTGQQPGVGAVIMRGDWLRVGSLIVAWLCVALALARPQIIEAPITKTIPVRDLLLAVDLSGSMETQDFTDAQGNKVDRLTAVKEVLADFLAKRQGDRVGLIFFGSAPFVQAPFTEDLNVCRELLDEAQVKMAGPQTAFGDALGLAMTVFDRSTVQERVLIALTDGNDTASKVPPAKAAEIAKDKGIVVHTISVGDPKAAGEDALDVDALKNVANTSGGIYAHAADRTQLDAIYRKLDAMETHKSETVSHRPRRDVFWWPLILGLVVTALQHALGFLSHRPRTRPSSSNSSTEDRGRERARRTRTREEAAA
jgi:Ca-activated chloride channel family protein